MLLRIFFQAVLVIITANFTLNAQINSKAKEAFNKGYFEKSIGLYRKNLSQVAVGSTTYNSIIYNLAEAYRYAGNYRLADSLHATVDYTKVSYWGYALTLLQQYRPDKCQTFAKYHLKFDALHPELNRINWACELAKRKADESKVILKPVAIPKKKERFMLPGFLIGNQQEKEALYLFEQYAAGREGSEDKKGVKFPINVSGLFRKGKEEVNLSISTPSKVGYSIHPEFFNFIYHPDYYNLYKVSSKSKMIYEDPKNLPDSLKSFTHFKEFDFYEHKEVVKQAWVSPHKNVMVFSSNKLKGEGGYDLFISTLTSTGWTKPVNLGERVNSPYNELYPFISPNGILYFSSNGRDGHGGYDIYSFDLNQMEYDEAVNLPKPFNSAFDDYAYMYHEQTGHGVFASTRPNGIFSGQLFHFENKTVNCDASLVFSESPPITNRNNKPKFCIDFDKLSLQDSLPSGKIFIWNMGDGKKQRGLKFNYCYSKPGLYKVGLGLYDPLTKETEITRISYDIAAVEKDYFYIDYASMGKMVEFTTTLSSCKKCTNQNYYWDFGDGNFACGHTVSHTYKEFGTYQVKLIVQYKKDKASLSYSCFERVFVEENR